MADIIPVWFRRTLTLLMTVLVAIGSASCSSKRYYGGCGGGGVRETKIEMVGVRAIDSVDAGPVLKPLVQLMDLYPYEMRRQGVSAEVVVRFLVNSNGATSDMRIVRTDNTQFDDAALRIARMATFFPAKQNDKPVPCMVEGAVVFAIVDE